MGSAAELGEEATVFGHPGTTAAMGQPYVFMEGVSLPAKEPSALPDVEISADMVLVVGSGRYHDEVVPLIGALRNQVERLQLVFLDANTETRAPRSTRERRILLFTPKS